MPFILFEGSLNLPKDGFAGLADGDAQRSKAPGGIEGKGGHKLGFFIPHIRIHTAASHDGVGRAYHHCLVKGIPDVFFIILGNEGTVNVVENVLLICIPICVGLMVGDFFNQVRKRAGRANVKMTHQGIGNSQLMLLPELEQIGIAGVCAALGIRHIKHIFQLIRRE